MMMLSKKKTSARRVRYHHKLTSRRTSSPDDYATQKPVSRGFDGDDDIRVIALRLVPLRSEAWT